MVVYSNTYDYKKKLEDVNTWDIPTAEKKSLHEYANEYASGRITGRIGKNIDGTIEDVLCKLKLPLIHFNKNVEKLTEKEVKDFVDDLRDNKIRKKVRKRIGKKLKWVAIGNYEKKGKDKFLKSLSTYLKYRLENNPVKLAKFTKILKVVVTHVEKEIESLSYADFDNIYNNASSLSDRYYLLVNVWGGFRASEFHGILEQDIKLPNIEKGEEFVRIWIRHENSKTKGRMITLYGSDCYKVVKQYLEERKPTISGTDIPIYEKTHNSRKLWLRRLGIKYKLPLHPHLFRATCATWLVDKGILKEYTHLIEWFGWSYGSTTPNKYLNRANITLKAVDENVKQTRFEEIKAELELEKEKNNIEKIRTSNELKKVFNQNKYFAHWIKIFTDRDTGKITQEEATQKMKALQKITDEL